MINRLNSNIFWSSHSPLSTLSGTGLIILASSRLSFSILCAGALLWVFGLTSLVFSFSRQIIPTKGRMIILLFLSSFICGIFILLISIFNPLLIMGTSFFLILIPPIFIGSGFFEAVDLATSDSSNSVISSSDPFEIVARALLEAGVLAGIIIALSLIREPLGMGTLSFPGSFHGIFELFSNRETGSFATIRILSTSSGALLLLGYAIALYRYFKKDKTNNSEVEE